ncbi:MAG: hypothetical protein PF692_07695 [Kiritimatiellae bacterium]|nr:hypothetical protein [Kiritimatiellia bacterium]
MIITDLFDFLITDFSCRKIEKKAESWGIEVKYANNTTGIKITYEYREAYIFSGVCTLLKYPLHIVVARQESRWQSPLSCGHLSQVHTPVIFLTIYQLHNGVMLDLPAHIDEKTKLYCFGFDDAIYLLAPDKLLKPLYDYDESSIYCDKENGFKEYVRQFANNLRVIGAPFLNGNFSLMPQLKSIITKRIEQWEVDNV